MNIKLRIATVGSVMIALLAPSAALATLTVGSDALTASAGLTLNGAAGSDLLLGSAAVGGAVTIGGATQTGTLTLGQSTATNTVLVGVGNLTGSSIGTYTFGNGTIGASATTNIHIGGNSTGSGTTTINIGSAQKFGGTSTVNISAVQGASTDIVNIGHASNTLNLIGAVKVTSMTSGSVLFAGTGGAITQDNTNLYFNDSTNKLSIGGNTSPAYTLNVHASTESAMTFTNASSGVTGTDGLYVGIDSQKIAYIWNYETGGAAGPLSFGTAGAQTMYLNTTGDLSITGDTFKIGATASPASGAACEAGQMSWDLNYIYVCTANLAWKRAALTGGY